MRNRWFHRPQLHSPDPGHEKKVAWLELFYDLVYVGTIIQLGNALSNGVSVNGFLAFAGLFAPIWLAWTSFTFFVNRFEVDDMAHRGMVFVQMFAVAAMAISIPDVIERGDATAFAWSYAAARLLLLGLYLRAYTQVPEARDLCRRFCILFAVDAALWIASVFVDPPWTYAFWAAGVGIQLSIPMNRHGRELEGKHPTDIPHMSERYGLLVIIVLGESFVKVLTTLYDKGAAADTILMGSMMLLITCSVWWIYFDDVAGSRIKRKALAPFVWIYTHLPMTIAVTAVGVAMKKVVVMDPGDVGAAKYRWLLCGSLGLVFLSVALIDAVTERRQAELSDRARVNVRLGSAAVIALLGAAGGFMSAGVFVGLVTTVCLAQVVFDLMMAPLEADEHMVYEEVARRVAESAEPSKALGRPRRDALTSAVRRGTPSHVRRDLYFYFMEGTWTRFFMALAFTYLFVNVIFACLYLLNPGAIGGAQTDSFLDAFFFSVQTMSTIGYGAMTPLTVYGDVIVTIEAAVGLGFVALATGLMVAKASRPTSSVLFSKVGVINQTHGLPSLKFRLGNARGNEIVEATLRVVVLVDEVSPEGHTMRRLRDLKLVRDNSPLFALSWTVIHEIDETSPLWGVDLEHLDDHVVAFICTMLGHDSTYAQTVHARHLYEPEDLRVGYRFVDVISSTSDGRLLVDYTKFHDVEPIDTSVAPESADRYRAPSTEGT